MKLARLFGERSSDENKCVNGEGNQKLILGPAGPNGGRI